MPFEIDISVESDLWVSAIPDIETRTTDILTSVLRATLPNHKDLEISVVLADDIFIHNLNKTYRGKDKPTNVLSFPMTEIDDLKKSSFLSLGDIVIAFETIVAEAKDQQKSLIDHFTHMLVHGCLHLLHYDHETELEANTMENIEITLLHNMGIKNPYETL